MELINPDTIIINISSIFVCYEGTQYEVVEEVAEELGW